MVRVGFASKKYDSLKMLFREPHKTLPYSSCHYSLYIKVKMGEVQLKALELLPQMNDNSQTSVLSQNPF